MYKKTLIILLITYVTTAVDVPKLKLNSGGQMPVIGIGTWKSRNDSVTQEVKDALAAGYRHIDTAEHYGNEKEVGLGLAASIAAGVVKREDVFITTKVYPSSDMTATEARNYSIKSIRNSLMLLNVSYVDLILVHHPRMNYTEMYRGLQDAYDLNLTRSIGVSNFNVTQLQEIITNFKVKPSNNQIEIHPKLSQDEVVDYCKKNDITVTGWSPLGGVISNETLITDKTLVGIGAKHNKTAAQVMIRWQIERGLIVIPKSVHKERIIENFNVFDFKLTDDEIKTINAMK